MGEGVTALGGRTVRGSGPGGPLRGSGRPTDGGGDAEALRRYLEAPKAVFREEGERLSFHLSENQTLQSLYLVRVVPGTLGASLYRTLSFAELAGMQAEVTVASDDSGTSFHTGDDRDESAGRQK